MQRKLWLELSGDWSRSHEELLIHAASMGLTTCNHVGLFLVDKTENLWSRLPHTTRWLQDRGWQPQGLYWIAMCRTGNVHIDESLHKSARINFPVTNCDRSRTTYHELSEKRTRVVTPNKIIYHHQEETRVIDGVTLTRPTILDVSWPHRVETWLEPGQMRVAASIMVFPNAGYLLNHSSPNQDHTDG